MVARRTLCALGFAGLIAAPANAQAATLKGQELPIPASAWLEWRTLTMVASPDSSGVWWWAHSYVAGQKDTHFSSYFDPARTQAWIGDARAFLAQPLSDADTGTVRTSPILTAFGGDGVYLARHKAGGSWAKDRFIVMEMVDNGERVLVNGDEKSILMILDTLLAVSRRTNFVAFRAPDSTESGDDSRGKPAAANPANRPPPYPEDERIVNNEGRVLLSFIVAENGRADMTSVKVLYATNRAFLQSVIKALRPMQFFPATVDGKPVRQRVAMPFMFSLIR